MQSRYCTDVLGLDCDAEHYTRNGVVGECPPSLFDVDDDDGRVLKAPNTWQQSSKSRVIAAKLPAARIHGVSPFIWLQYPECILYCTGYQHDKGNFNGGTDSKLAYSTKKIYKLKSNTLSVS